MINAGLMKVMSGLKHQIIIFIVFFVKYYKIGVVKI